MQGRLEGANILDASMRLEWELLALPIHLEHQIFIPIIIAENGRHVFGHPHRLPVDVALLSHTIHIVWHQNIVPQHIQFVGVELQEIVSHPNAARHAQYFNIEVIWLWVFCLHLPLYAF